MTIQFQDYPKVNTDSSDATLYGDIITHCKDWKHYAEPSSKYTTAHEITHGINNDLRLLSGDWDHKNGFYVGQDRAVILDEPKIKKSDIIPFIPQELRSTRFSLYVQGQQSWDDKPLYIYDEGVAYTNGAWAAIQLKEQENYVEGMQPTMDAGVRKHLLSDPRLGLSPSFRYQGGNTIVDGQIEFIPYMTAVLMATEKLTGSVDQRLLDFSKWLFRHASNAYYRTLKDGFPKFDVQDKLWTTLKTDASCADMRSFLYSMVEYTCPDSEVPEDDNPPWSI